jgi:ribosomal-protein-serine acetyltransferase
VRDLVVRPWTEDDAPALEAAVNDSLAHLTPWMPWAREPSPGVAGRRAWIREQNAIEAGGGDRVRGFFTPAGEVIGAGGLHRRVGPDGWEIGYWVHARWTRRGIATAAVAVLVAEAFADPDVAFAEIHHDVANTASGGVAAKAGFTHVGDADGERRWRLTRAGGS